MNRTPRVFAIADLHLSGQQDKQMNIFGEQWDRHWDKIRQDWTAKVLPEDIVLIPGDISWAMSLDKARDDLMEISHMPGVKCLLRGNHDYWWSAIGRLRAFLPTGMLALQNDALVFDGVTICGARGWMCPGHGEFAPEDQKIYQREVQRLEMSLRDGFTRAPGQPIVAMTHFPPFNEQREPSGFTQLMEGYQVVRAVYGHLHGPSLRNVFEGICGGVDYRLVSCDYLNFSLRRVF